MHDYKMKKKDQAQEMFLKLKVTVQFETEGNGQNEIVSRMDRSDLKL